jgi:hypothetical protein
MKKLPKRVKTLLKENQIAEDLIDHTLSEEEMLNKLKQMGIQEKSPTTKEEYFNNFENDLKKRIEQDLENMKSPNTDIYYQELFEMLELFLNSPTFNLLIISGRAGIGKSYKIIEWTKNNINIEAFKYNGHITPFQLFHILYNHNSNSLVVFDDSNPILDNVSSVSLLLQACETMNTRVISWNTSKPVDIPPRFSFDGKVVILTNRTFDEIDEALQSRAIKFSLEFDNYKTLEIINSLCQLPEKNLIISLLKDNINRIEINLRLYKLLENLLVFLKSHNKLESFQKFGGIIIEMESNKNLRICYELFKNTSDIKKLIQKFMEETGSSKKTFYRYKEKIECLLGLKV